jgi:hypothetical protein
MLTVLLQPTTAPTLVSKRLVSTSSPSSRSSLRSPTPTSGRSPVLSPSLRWADPSSPGGRAARTETSKTAHPMVVSPMVTRAPITFALSSDPSAWASTIRRSLLFPVRFFFVSLFFRLPNADSPNHSSFSPVPSLHFLPLPLCRPCLRRRYPLLRPSSPSSPSFSLQALTLSDAATSTVPASTDPGRSPLSVSPTSTTVRRFSLPPPRFRSSTLFALQVFSSTRSGVSASGTALLSLKTSPTRAS